MAYLESNSVGLDSNITEIQLVSDMKYKYFLTSAQISHKK